MRGPPGAPAPAPNATGLQSAFSVRLGDYNPSSNRVLRFTEIIYNGENHYSARSGEFICAIPGVYQFGFVCTSSIEVGDVDLRRNGASVLSGFKLFQRGVYTSSGDTVLRLEPGDRVWLEASEGTNGLSTSSFFSGHLLFPVP